MASLKARLAPMGKDVAIAKRRREVMESVAEEKAKMEKATKPKNGNGGRKNGR